MGSKPSAFPEDREYHNLQITCQQRGIFSRSAPTLYLPAPQACGYRRQERRGWKDYKEQRAERKHKVTSRKWTRKARTPSTGWNLTVQSRGCAERAWECQPQRRVLGENQIQREEVVSPEDMAVKARRKWEGKSQEPAETKRSKIGRQCSYLSHPASPSSIQEEAQKMALSDEESCPWKK